MFPRIFPVVGSLLVVFLMFAAPQMSQASRQFPGYFHIINAATHEVLECKTLPDGQTLLHPGAHVGTPNQEWEILGAGQDRFKIINRAFHFVLELKTGDHINGADILAAVETQGAEQLWTLTEHQPNQFSIRNLVSGKPLEIQPSLEDSQIEFNSGIFTAVQTSCGRSNGFQSFLLVCILSKMNLFVWV